MPRTNELRFAMNRGIVSKLGLARADLEKRVGLSAEVQTNFLPRVLGSMMLRPGWEYIDSTRNDAAARHLRFVFANDDTAIVELTDSVLRVRVDEEIISRPSVSTAITNGGFGSNVTGWTDADVSGAVSQWATGGYLELLGTGTTAAIRTQQVTVGGADQNVEHALNVSILRGPVVIRVGSSSGADDYVSEATLGTGAHSLAFTPTGDFHIQLSNRRLFRSYVDSIQVASSGAMEIASPWGADDLPLLRYDQSGDVIFVAGGGKQQRRIERRATRSWSLVKYEPEDGPFRPINTGPVTLTPDTLSGDITLTASAPLFKSRHVGALFRIASTGQKVSGTFGSANAFTGSIRVTGVGGSRAFAVQIAGTFSATFTLQRSITEPGNWEDVTTYTTPTVVTYNDALDNQIVYYRIGVKTGDYTSGSADASLIYSLGSITGVAQITAYTSETSVSARALSALGNITPSEDWSESVWSDRRGWPSSIVLHEGRIWWPGKDRSIGSVSDAFASFDDATEGDSGPINRSIGSGPVDTINWALSLDNLVLGGQGAEHVARSSLQGEPLTPTNFNIKQPSTQGSSAVAAAKVDTRGVFVQKSGLRLFMLEPDQSEAGYTALDMTALVPEIGESGIVCIAVQRTPDTRIHCVLGNGKVGVLIFDRAEDVKCWVLVETSGKVEEAFVMPGDEEDKVYYVVNRTINGATKRYIERWALESECRDGTLVYDGDSTSAITDLPYRDGKSVTARDADGVKIGEYTVSDGAITLASPATYAAITPTLYKLADSFKAYSGTATTTITGLSHLEGEAVAVWGNGKYLGEKTVASGEVAGLSEAVTSAVVGLPYEAKYKSSKLAYASGMGTPLTQRKRVHQLGILTVDTHASGLTFGPDFTTMDDMPQVEDGAAVDADYVWPEYDKDMLEFPGEWNTDARICLKASAPKPATVLALVIGIETHDK